MILRHVRSNAVAYLALIVALSTGTAYAAGQLADGSVTSAKLAKNSVTSAKIKPGQVKSSDLAAKSVSSATVKDGSLKAADLAPGAAAAPAWAHLDFQALGDPDANPDIPGAASTTFTAPRAGLYYVRFFAPSTGVDCDSALGQLGLGLDGSPVPNTSTLLGSTTVGKAKETLAVVQLTAGPHTLTADEDCPFGDVTGSLPLSGQSWTVLPASG